MYAGLAPHDALAIYAVIAYLDSVAGVYFPRGGIHAVPRALAGAAEKHGVRDPVRHHGDPRRDRAAAGPPAVHHRRRRAHPGRRRGAQPRPAGRLPRPAARPPPAAPAALLAVLRGAARRIAARRTRKIAHHNIHFGRAWTGTFDEVIRRGELMSDPSLLVTNPSRTDPALAPAGRQTYYVLAPGAQPATRRRWTGAAASPSATPTSSIADAGGARLRRLRRRRRGAARSITPADWADAGHGRRHAVRRRAHASSRPARSARATCTRHCPTWSSSAPAPSPASACRWC